MESNKNNKTRIDGGSEQKSKTFDKRFQSVRRPPQGQFNKYRQMFDALTKRTTTKDKSHNENTSTTNLNKNPINSASHNYNNISTKNDINQNDVNHLISTTKLINSNSNNLIMNMPYTDDEKSNHIYKSTFLNCLNNKNTNNYSNTNLYYTLDKMENLEEYDKKISKNSKIFEGISDETNKLLNNLCTNNRQIAEFFEKPSTSSTSPSKMNVYKAVPYHLTNDIDLTKNDIYEATYEDSIVTTTTTNSCFSTLNKYNKNNNNVINSSPTCSSNSFSIYPTETRKYDNYDNLNTYCKMTNNESNYFELDDVEFSDDSYENGSYDDDDEEQEQESNIDYDGDEDDNVNDINTSITDLTNVAVPPPKPVRTFEHDVYINSKDSQPSIISNNNNNLAAYLNNENNLYVPSNNFKRNDKTRSLFNKMLFGKEIEHVYETLPSFKEPSPVNLSGINDKDNRVRVTTYKKNSNYASNNSKINKKDNQILNSENNRKLVNIFFPSF
jgi:hypothetical protein